MVMPELTSDVASVAGMSPKKIAGLLILRLYEKFFDNMAANPDVNMDRMTAAILISCPEKAQRERLWKLYVDTRDEDENLPMETRVLTAAIKACGEWWQYQCNAMGLNDETTGGG